MFWKKKTAKNQAEEEIREPIAEEKPAAAPEQVTKPVLPKSKINYQLQFFEPGGVIFYEGESGHCFYDILDGLVGVYVRYGQLGEQLITTLGKGDYFGEMAIIESCPRTATIVALKSGTMVRLINQECLAQYAEECPENVLRIMLSMGKRVNKLTRENNGLRSIVDAFMEKQPSIKTLQSEEVRSAMKLAGIHTPEE